MNDTSNCFDCLRTYDTSVTGHCPECKSTRTVEAIGGLQLVAHTKPASDMESPSERASD